VLLSPGDAFTNNGPSLGRGRLCERHRDHVGIGVVNGTSDARLRYRHALRHCIPHSCTVGNTVLTSGLKEKLHATGHVPEGKRETRAWLCHESFITLGRRTYSTWSGCVKSAGALRRRLWPSRLFSPSCPTRYIALRAGALARNEKEGARMFKRYQNAIEVLVTARWRFGDSGPKE
jgi:hypothetical protein